MHEELFMDVLDKNDEFGIHLHTANECFVVFGCRRDEVERFGLFQRYLHVFVNMNNQHVSKQTACFISGSCRMFLRWFLMFSTFLQQVQMELEMDMRKLR